MACLYKRERSPFWWVEHIDANGERRQQSTKCRHDSPGKTREARALRDELATRELTRSVEGNRCERWAAWVPRFIDQRYAVAGNDGRGTRERCETAWRNIEVFLAVNEITVPRQLTRQQVRDFVQWRQRTHGEFGTRKAAKNTALLEVKFLSAIMHEAVESGFAAANPCLKLGIKRNKAKLKPKIEEDEHRLITRALKGEEEWMRVSYKIGWEQGCRFSETCLPMSDVDLTNNTLGLRTKGEKESVARVPLSPNVRPLFRRLIKMGRERTFEMPLQPSRKWWRFFRKIGLPHLCFHCTRVSFISRCYERGIPKETVMLLVLHADETVHQVYPRVSATGRHLQEAMRRAAA